MFAISHKAGTYIHCLLTSYPAFHAAFLLAETECRVETVLVMEVVHSTVTVQWDETKQLLCRTQSTKLTLMFSRRFTLVVGLT